MADEIQMTARLYASKGGAFLPSVTYTKSATMAGVDMGSQTQSIGASSSEILDVPVDVTAPYKLLISNLDNDSLHQREPLLACQHQRGDDSSDLLRDLTN